MNNFFETIKAVNGFIYNLPYHQKRYESVLDSFAVSNVKKLQDFISPPLDGLYRCRVVYNDNMIDVQYYKYKKRKITTLKLVYDDVISYNFKSVQRRELNLLFDKKETADDILIVKNSLLTDTTIANIALYDGQTWFTPRVSLLNGTTRQRLLDDGKIKELDIKAKDIYKYKKIALLNAMIDFDIIKAKNLKDIIC